MDPADLFAYYSIRKMIRSKLLFRFLRSIRTGQCINKSDQK